LAITLLSNPDVLLLDEPTNHLDLDMIEWLESYLEGKNITLVMVTHDRYFLETICNTIWELDKGNLYTYPGNYSYFMEKKAEREQIQVVNLDKAKNLYKKELEWMRKMPKARTTKAKSRIDSFYEVQDKASQKIKKDELDLNIKNERLGSKIIEYHKVQKSYGEKLILNDFSYNFKRFEKLGIVGPNGVGKTTLLKLTTNELEPDKGKIVIGETVKIGYYKQQGLQLPEDLRVIEYIKNIAEIIPLEKGKKLTASQMLERFMFSPDMQYQYISTLSGGEKKRLYLLGTLMDNPNFLILDEPTNDLDIFTMNVLEDFLENFAGNVLVVSHDRYFMDKIVDHLFVMEGDGEIREITGNYSVYRATDKSKSKKKQEENPIIETKVNPAPTPAPAKEKKKSKLNFNQKREFESLETEIEKLEQRKVELTGELNNPNLGHEELIKIGADLEKIIADLDQKSERWLELSEMAE
jgi:ATP-binding cassette subfamily F protein uup